MKPHQRTVANAKAGARLKVGYVVSVRGSTAVASRACPEGRENHSKARIAALLDPHYPGGVYLDRDLHGCRYWNAEDLKVVSKTPAK